MSNETLALAISAIAMLSGLGQFVIMAWSVQPKRRRPTTHWKKMKVVLNSILWIMVFMGFWKIWGFVSGDGAPTRYEINNLGLGIMLLLEALILHVSFKAIDRDRFLLARMDDLEKRLLSGFSMHSNR